MEAGLVDNSRLEAGYICKTHLYNIFIGSRLESVDRGGCYQNRSRSLPVRDSLQDRVELLFGDSLRQVRFDFEENKHRLCCPMLRVSQV